MLRRGQMDCRHRGLCCHLLKGSPGPAYSMCPGSRGPWWAGVEGAPSQPGVGSLPVSAIEIHKDPVKQRISVQASCY